MFLSPLRKERTPSFSVRYDKGLWYDFGLGEGGTLLQLVMRLEGCGMAEAIRRLRKGAANEASYQPLPTASPRKDSPMQILGVGEIRHPALIGYLRERGIDPTVAGALCREIHYAVGERSFFAIGFRNDAGGWELRSPQFKGSSAPKNITTFDRHGDTALLFEGFFDLLSYLTLQHEPEPAVDTAVLNSVVNLPRALPFLARHATIHAFLDNDEAGHLTLERLRNALPGATVIVARNDAGTVAHPSAASRPRLFPRGKSHSLLGLFPTHRPADAEKAPIGQRVKPLWTPPVVLRTPTAEAVSSSTTQPSEKRPYHGICRPAS